MSHHFDTPTAREDPRVNLCDFYLFRKTPGTVTLALKADVDRRAIGGYSALTLPGTGGDAYDTFRSVPVSRKSPSSRYHRRLASVLDRRVR